MTSNYFINKKTLILTQQNHSFSFDPHSEFSLYRELLWTSIGVLEALYSHRKDTGATAGVHLSKGAREVRGCGVLKGNLDTVCPSAGSPSAIKRSEDSRCVSVCFNNARENAAVFCGI